mgnify:FL=1
MMLNNKKNKQHQGETKMITEVYTHNDWETNWEEVEAEDDFRPDWDKATKYNRDDFVKIADFDKNKNFWDMQPKDVYPVPAIWQTTTAYIVWKVKTVK